MIEFENNSFLPTLFGERNSHLKALEDKLNVKIISQGNRISAEGSNSVLAENILLKLYYEIEQGREVTMDDVKGAAQTAEITEADMKKLMLKTQKEEIRPRTVNQALFVKAMQESDLVFGVGPAGTGKTFLAVAYAVHEYLKGNIQKIILTRPAVEAGENLGFLPGSIADKFNPYMQPLYDALRYMMKEDQVQKLIENRTIEAVPVAFMRGRTICDCFVILDEAQNTTTMQMKMLLTRIGLNSKMIINGDMSQVDLLPGIPSGLRESFRVLHGVEGVGFVKFTTEDVVRHDLVARIIDAYQNYGRKKRNARNQDRD